MMSENELGPVGDQLLFAGIPERDPKLPPTKGPRQRLTLKQKKFAMYRLEGKGIGEAARLAGYSDKSADCTGSKLAKKSQVSEFIIEQEEKAIKEAGINRKDALLRLAKMVYWDPRNLYREDGSIKPPSEWDDATAAVIAGVEVMELWGNEGKHRVSIGQTKKVKVVDPLRSLEVLLKVLGLQKETVVYPDRDGNPMSPGTVINQTQKIVFEFINAPGPGGLEAGLPGQSLEEGPVIEGEMGRGKED
jgi:phage terminase small subunit